MKKTALSKDWVLDKNHLSYWLRQLRKEMVLIAPLRERGDIVLRQIDNIHDIALDCPANLPSPKEFLFPQFETMLNKGGNGIKDLSDGTKRVIFGIRSCDVSARNIADKFYLDGGGMAPGISDPLGGVRDPYYAKRRENTLFISVVCNVPDTTCFCSGLGTGPYLREGFDIQLYDLGDRYLVQAGSKETEKLIKRYSFLMRRPEKADIEDQYEVEVRSRAMFQKNISLEGARQKIKDGSVPDSFWRGVTDRCFECGGCVYQCPLCTCFTVIDRNYGGEAERSRLWDVCLFKGFTRMAGGVLPTKDRMLRTKRWFYHKLIYDPDTLGAFGCVGCGRCTIACPGRIDMATVVSKMP